jgi:glycerophosphoryl diester phosphodiesterase
MLVTMRMRGFCVGWLVAGLAFLPLPAGAQARATFDVQGHRGARGLLPENTLAGFVRAMELGVTTIELDVGITRDGHVIAAHDPYVNPALCLAPTGDALAGERGPLLRHLDLQEVQAFDCGSLNPDVERFTEPPRVNVPGQRMPTLREVFALARQRGETSVRFNVEMKTNPSNDDTLPLDAFVAKVVEVIRSERMLARVNVQAFDWRALELAKRLEPGLQTAALLAQLDPLWQAGLTPEANGGVLGMLRAADAYIDIFSPYWPLLVEGEKSYAGTSVAEYQAAGFPVVPWTINGPKRMRQMLELGVDGIITDYPNRLLRVLKESR